MARYYTTPFVRWQLQSELQYDLWLRANTVKHRTHSLFRQGLMLYEHIPNWPEHRLRPLMDRFAQMLMEQPLYRNVFAII